MPQKSPVTLALCVFLDCATNLEPQTSYRAEWTVSSREKDDDDDDDADFCDALVSANGTAIFNHRESMNVVFAPGLIRGYKSCEFVLTLTADTPDDAPRNNAKPLVRHVVDLSRLIKTE